MDITKVTGLKKATLPETAETYGALDASTQKLIQAAIEVRNFAYAPYSNFKVGAAFRSKCGRIFTGCNVESSCFTPTSCAERTAICKAISEGCREFVAGAVVAFQENALTTPCGVCRQLIVEFATEDIPLYVTKSEDGVEKLVTDAVLCTSIYNLLPNAFSRF